MNWCFKIEYITELKIILTVVNYKNLSIEAINEIDSYINYIGNIERNYEKIEGDAIAMWKFIYAFTESDYVMFE